MMGRLEFNKVTPKLPFTNEKIAVKTNYSFLPDTNDFKYHSIKCFNSTVYSIFNRKIIWLYEYYAIYSIDM